MRLGAWLALLGLALPVGACSGSYPLPPTRCDEYCDATKGGGCADYYNPAACVSACEQSNTDAEECRAQFDLVVSCLHTHPNAPQQRCVYNGLPDDCDNEAQSLLTCVGSQYGGSQVNR